MTISGSIVDNPAIWRKSPQPSVRYARNLLGGHIFVVTLPNGNTIKIPEDVYQRYLADPDAVAATAAIASFLAGHP